jgi:hypothetical protein
MWGRVLLLCAVLSGLVVGGVMVAILMIDAHVKGRPAASPWVVSSVVAGAGVAAFTLVLGLMLHIFAKKSARDTCRNEYTAARHKQTALEEQRSSSVHSKPRERRPVATGRRKHAQLAKGSVASDARRYYTTSPYRPPCPPPS